jgi:hypothetical protein
MDIKHSALVPTGLAGGIWPISNTPLKAREQARSARKPSQSENKFNNNLGLNIKQEPLE